MIQRKRFLNLLFMVALFFVNKITASQTSSCNDGEKNCVSTQCATRSKSFYRPRSVLEDSALFQTLNNYNFHRKYFEPDSEERQGHRIHLSRGIFFQKTAKKDTKNLGKFFLPNKKCLINIAEDGSGDVGSLWLKVISPDGDIYRSAFTLQPDRSVIGGFFDLRHYFECYEGAWIETKFAVYQVTHKLNAFEKLADSNVTGTLPGARTALEYFNSNNLNYGKIANHHMELAGFDDLEVKFGYDYTRSIDCGYYAGLYGSVIFPISSQPNARYLFEPLLGRAHWGLGVGFNGGYKVWERDNHNLTLLTDLSFNYLFKRKELRSLDLKNNGEWSRYLRVSTASQPGISAAAINYTTLPVEVTPKGILNFWGAAHYQHCKWHVEAGYNLWWKQAEKVCLPKNNCDCTNFDKLNLGIFDMGNVCTPTSANTANISQGKTVSGIGNVVVSDPTFVPLTLSDLDLASTSQPKALTNKVYGAVSYDLSICNRLINVGAAASFEFSKNLSALQQWGVWGYGEVCF